jgi:Protein of unknown function (DUF1064)
MPLRNKKKSWHSNFKRKSAIERTIDGVTFASAGEMKRYWFLKVMQSRGIITNLVIQPRFELIIEGRPCKYDTGRTIRYVADFKYNITTTGEDVIEDYKGFDEKLSRLKRAVVEAIYKIKIRVVKKPMEGI